MTLGLKAFGLEPDQLCMQSGSFYLKFLEKQPKALDKEYELFYHLGRRLPEQEGGKFST
jgi:hypothetical protein